jgi:hypothetical protein
MMEVKYMVITRIALKFLDFCIWLTYCNYALYRWMLSHFPAHIEDIALHLAWRSFLQAQRQVPAYKTFLSLQNTMVDGHGLLAEQFARIPETEKKNYIYVFNLRTQSS